MRTTPLHGVHEAWSTERRASTPSVDVTPEQVVVADAGGAFSLVLGDSLYIGVAVDGAAGLQFVVAGMRSEQIHLLRPRIAWSRNGGRLVAWTGVGGVFDGGVPFVVDVEQGAQVRPLLPDSLAARLRTVGTFASQAPVWDPTGTRFSFLAADTAVDPRTIQVWLAEVGGDRIAVALLTFGPSSKQGMAWSSSGDSLFFSTGDFRTGSASLNVIEVETGRVRELADVSVAYLTDLRLSRDASALLATGPDDRGHVFGLASAESGANASHTPLPPEFKPLDWTLGGNLLGSRETSLSREPALLDPDEPAAVERLELEGMTSGIWTPLGLYSSEGRTELVFRFESGSALVPPGVWAAELLEDSRSLLNRRLLYQRRSNVEATGELFAWESEGGDAQLFAQLFLPASRRSAGYPLVIVPSGGYSDQYPDESYFPRRLDPGTPLEGVRDRQAEHPRPGRGFCGYRPLRRRTARRHGGYDSGTGRFEKHRS